MAKFVPDIKTQRWIVISPARWDRPDDHVPESAPTNICVFCPGNEQFTPPEIMRLGFTPSAQREGDGEKNGPGWSIRVIPNKFPITDVHEVIIHSTDHKKDIEDFEPQHVVALFGVFRTRFQTHAPNGQVMIFCNHGERAGASLRHAHSQVVVLPRQINLDALVREPMLNVVEEVGDFVSYCPDFSQWPYEVWIAPKKEGTVFGEVNDEELGYLAGITQKTIKRLAGIYETRSQQKFHSSGPFAYNYYIHHSKSWFIRIIPRLVHRAGFELGTGLSVNVVDPTIAAEELRKIEV